MRLFLLRLNWLFFFVFVGVGLNLHALELPTPKLPKEFWAEDPAIKKKIDSGRGILVSVKSAPVETFNALTLQGVGKISAPVNYVKEWVLHFDHLRRVSDYVKEVRWDQKKKDLYFHTAAFDYHARMHIAISHEDLTDGRVIKFKVVQGVFTGLIGELKVTSAGFKQSLVSLVGAYNYKTWVLPKIFLEFGLEVVIEKFSQRLRTLIEEDFARGRWTPPTSTGGQNGS